MGFFGPSKKVKKAQQTSPPPTLQPPPPQPSQPPAAWHNDAQLHPPPGPGRPFQPAGYLPPPQGWSSSPPLQPSYTRPYAPIVVNQHYYLSSPPPTGAQRPQTSNGALTKLNLGSVVNFASDLLPMDLPHFFDDGRPTGPTSRAWNPHPPHLPCGTQLLNQGAALYDQISSKFDNVMTMIDRDRYAGNEGELFMYQPPPVAAQAPPSEASVDRALGRKGKTASPKKDHPKGQTTAVAASVISGNYFAKVDLYSNSRLPMDLPPLKLYIPTYPLLCLAAQFSEAVYRTPRGAELSTHVSADWRTGTKAMVIKSVPADYMNTIVFAIRGTATFMDWAVNLNTAPTAPTRFLDDEGNLCHSGFLSVARKMIKPVAARLRQLLEEDPGRSEYSLLITGHSAGGAVAGLLYSHMLATSTGASSELNALTGCFRRVHCVTFGTPPVSLLPLVKPDRKELKKSLFLSFVNEGDPVARADKVYVKSLLELFSAPAPLQASKLSGELVPGGKTPKQSKSKASLLSNKSGKSSRSGKSKATGPVWKVPPAALSSAGRIVVLRCGDPKARLKGKKTVEERLNEGVVAQIATDEQLRGVIWGDPVCHVMRLYAGRIETLAVGAITATG